MADKSGVADNIIALPDGGGAQRGIGETFAPDLQTGTGNFTVPVVLPAGRNGFQPHLNLAYSSGQGNGAFGLGWSLGVPAVSRKTSKGVPRYRDNALDPSERDTFLLSGAEDLVPLAEGGYRPRTDGLFAQIERHEDYWEIRSKDGLVSRYGAALTDPADATRIFAWKLTETEDRFGNRIEYDYRVDQNPGGPWVQSYLERVRYVDFTEAGQTQYLISVDFSYEARPDAFSDRRAGFEIRTRLRCSEIRVTTHLDQARTVRTYRLLYTQAPLSGVSLLGQVDVLGWDGADRLPPLEFGYTTFEPQRRHRLIAGTEGQAPPASLARPDYELADLSGDGLPDVLEMNGTVRYWRNLGGGRFDQPRTMKDAPAGVALADRGVQLMDADGDARIDLVLTRDGLAGYFPLRFDGGWDRTAFRPYRPGPSFDLEDPEVKLVDLDGDGVADLIRSGHRLTGAFNDYEHARWHDLRVVDGPPPMSFADPRVRWADLTGDGLQDLVLVHHRRVEYWPNAGHGHFGSKVVMQRSPSLPVGYDPKRILLGDVEGDGLADFVYVEDGKVTLWINQSGNGWSDPVEIAGTPAVADTDAVRLVDLLGTGVAGVLWSADAAQGLPRANLHFLDFTDASKPHLLNRMDNHLGAITRVRYRPSTADYLDDAARRATRWRTPLPFPVQVVADVEMHDAISGGKLTTEYRYHHGYWDGREREFRGFGLVEQRDTESFGRSDTGVPEARFSPPTLTRTWFHLGPVADAELSYEREFWSEDPPAFGRHPSLEKLLAGLPRRGDRLDAIRALRGRVLRTELYALDNSADPERPYTVTEAQYGIREESPPGPSEPTRRRIFFPFLAAQRTTQWERGHDPLTQFAFTEAYDAFGQPAVQTAVALPRRRAMRRAITGATVGTIDGDEVNETRVLATHTRTSYAQPEAGVHMRDRVAQARTFALRAPPGVEETAPANLKQVLVDHAAAAAAVRDAFAAQLGNWLPGQPLPDALRLIGHTLNHYDGSAFAGRAAGEIGPYGALTRSETLVFTDEELDDAYGDRRPAYLGGPSALPPGAPSGVGSEIGYRREARSASGYHDGYYADTARHRLDVQAPQATDPRGLLLATQDALGHEVTIEPDRFGLLPERVSDPAGLVTTAQYDERTLLPASITDPNGHTTRYTYSPLGLLKSVVLVGRDGEGGTAAKPEIAYEYDLGAYDRTRPGPEPQPISAITRRRIRHASDAALDDTIETRTYSDGFGRVIQTRAQADELTFGDAGDDVGLGPGAGEVVGAAIGQRATDRVVVSGWQVYDNKGRVVERYESFFARGWAYQPEQEAKRGQHVESFYDPRGEPLRTLNPDGTERRVILGALSDPGDLDTVVASPWERSSYDANDLAAAAPAAHRFTPASSIADALGRPVCRIERNGTDPADWFVTRSEHDVRGNLIAVRDALGRPAFSYAYDLLGRSLRSDSIDAGVRTTVLDAAGNLVEYRDDKGSVVLRGYDRLNRLTQLWARDDDAAAVTLRERLEYGDAGDPDQPAGDRAAQRARSRLGRLHRHHDEAGLIELERYDFKGNVLERARQVIGDAALAGGWTADWAAAGATSALDVAIHRTRTSYDALNRVLSLTGPGQQATLTPHYGRSGALERVELDGVPYVEQIAYDARGQRVLIAYGNGVMTRCAYDPLSFRLTRLRSERLRASAADVWDGQGAPLQDLTYTYDPVGNIVAIEDRAPGCGIGGEAEGRDRLTRRFQYDPLYRLSQASGRACAGAPGCGSFTAAFQPGPPTPNQDNAPDLTEPYLERYTYDPVGNLLASSYTGKTATRNRSFGVGAADNRLTTLTQGASVSSFEHDRNGNLVRENTERRYAWDHADRLIAFTVAPAGAAQPSVEARYLYGADGQRVKKWLRTNGAGEGESTVYIDGVFEHVRWKKPGGLAAEHDLIHVLDDRSRIALIRRGPAHDDDAGPPIQYQLSDHLGSSGVVVDDSGAWINREEYFPYGETSFGGFARKRYRFTGKERDEKSGLNYHGARYYAPWLARWTACDPITQHDGSSPYAYGANSPMRLVDADGAAAGPPPVNATVSPANTGVTGTRAHSEVLPVLRDRINTEFADYFKARIEIETLPGGSCKKGSWEPGEIDISIFAAGRGEHMYDLKPFGTSKSYADQIFNYIVKMDTPVSAKRGTLLRQLVTERPALLDPIVVGDRIYTLRLPAEDGFIEYTWIQTVKVKVPEVEFKPSLGSSPGGSGKSSGAGGFEAPGAFETGVGAAGAVLTVYSLYQAKRSFDEAYERAVEEGSRKPLDDEALRQSLSWTHGLSLGMVGGLFGGPLGGLVLGGAGAEAGRRSADELISRQERAARDPEFARKLHVIDQFYSMGF